MSQFASLTRTLRAVLPELTIAFCLAPVAAAQTGWNLGPELRIASSLSGFGITVASDGERLAVGAPLEPSGGLADVGTVELYRRDPAGWISEGRLDPFDLAGLTQAQWGFGGAIDVAGELVVVGTPGHDGVCPGQFFCNSGAAYVFQRVAGQWTPDQILLPAGLEDNDKLGGAVAVAGNQLLASAIGDNDGGLLCGAVYVWEQVGGAWTVVQKLLPNDAQPRIGFGSNLRVDGDTLIVGAPRHPQGSSFTNTQGGRTSSAARAASGPRRRRCCLIPSAILISALAPRLTLAATPPWSACPVEIRTTRRMARRTCLSASGPRGHRRRS